MVVPAHNEPPPPPRKSRLKRLGVAVRRIALQQLMERGLLDTAERLLSWLIRFPSLPL